MIRIGFVRWLIQAELKPRNGGQTEVVLSLVPQAKRYKIFTKEWYGTRDSMVEKEVPAAPISVSHTELSYDLLRAKKLFEVAKRLTAELASSAIQYSIRTGLVNFENHNLIAVNYLVSTAIMRVVESGVSDLLELVDSIDLTGDMRTLYDERQRQRAADAQRGREAWAAHNAEQQAYREQHEKAVQISMDLLYSFLSPSERQEAETKGQVTVTNFAGKFVVPVTAHGLVKQYVNDEYHMSYCIVYRDYSIPVGDEALMKIALLKSDLQSFMKTANKFHEKSGIRRRVA